MVDNTELHGLIEKCRELDRQSAELNAKCLSVSAELFALDRRSRWFYGFGPAVQLLQCGRSDGVAEFLERIAAMERVVEAEGRER